MNTLKFPSKIIVISDPLLISQLLISMWELIFTQTLHNLARIFLLLPVIYDTGESKIRFTTYWCNQSVYTGIKRRKKTNIAGQNTHFNSKSGLTWHLKYDDNYF